MRQLRELHDAVCSAWHSNPQVFHNFAALGLIQVSAYAIPLVTLPYQLRVIGVEKYGVLAIAASLVQYLVLATDYGFRISASREISILREDGERTNRITSAVMVIKTAIALLTAVVLTFLLTSHEKFRGNETILWLTWGAVPANVLTLTWYFQGQEQMKYITWLTLGSRAWFATGLFLLVRRPEHFVLIPALSSSAEIVAGIVGIAIARKRFGLRFRLPGWQDLKEQMRLGWHVFVSTVAINGYTSTPTLAVGWFGGSRAAGYYSVAEKLAAIYQTFPLGSLLQAMYPRLSKIHAENPGRSYRLMRKAQAITTVAYAVTYPLVALLAPLAVRLITGKYVPEMQTAFAVMALATVGVNANAFHLQYLLVSGRHSIYSRLHVGMGLAGSGLVFLAAYFFTYLGPPWALIVINFAVLALTLRVISSIRRAEGLA